MKPIQSEPEYDTVLQRIDQLMDAPEGTAESDELEGLVTEVEAYEAEHYPIDLPTDALEK